MSELDEVLLAYIDPSVRHLPEVGESIQHSKQYIKNLVLDIVKNNRSKRDIIKAIEAL